jgi:hypothetical protein
LTKENSFISKRVVPAVYIDVKVEYDNRLIASMSYTKFLGITIKDTIYWESHIGQLLPKLSAACCAVKSSKNVRDSRNVDVGVPCLL